MSSIGFMHPSVERLCSMHLETGVLRIILPFCSATPAQAPGVQDFELVEPSSMKVFFRPVATKICEALILTTGPRRPKALSSESSPGKRVGSSGSRPGHWSPSIARGRALRFPARIWSRVFFDTVWLVYLCVSLVGN